MKTRNRVRIIGGTHRSRLVHFPEQEGLRPTNDFVREKLFNWLGQRLNGKTVLDLFSGSGVLAFESASRGAEQVIAVEKNHHTYYALTQQQKELQLAVNFIQGDALRYLKNSTQYFDLVFLDPPYVWQDWTTLWQLLLPHLKQDSLVYVESNQEITFPDTLICQKSGRSGMSYFSLLQSIY